MRNSRTHHAVRRHAAALSTAFAVLLALGGSATAQSDLETRLREALRSATTQVRALEDERAQLMAKQAQLESENETLKAQTKSSGGSDGKRVAELEKLFNEREQAYAAAVDEFNVRLQQERDQAVRIQETALKLKGALEEANAQAHQREADLKQASDHAERQKTRAEACEAHNQQLFLVGNEILDRYRDVGISDVLAAREPFIGLKRVELENLMQDFEDHLLDNQVATPASSE